MRFNNWTLALSVWLSLIATSGVEAGELEVTVTTPDIKDLVVQVGGKHVDVESLTKGTQDPHYVEAKPSYMLRLAKSDLLVSVGMGLEGAWLPAALSGARNRNLMPGASGSLVLGNFVKPLDVPTGKVSREHGDVHPEGNPHFTLDPVTVSDLAVVIGTKLAELLPAKKAEFSKNAKKFQEQIAARLPEWKKQINQSGVKEVITYHKTLAYFLSRFQLKAVEQIEPKPGIPPNPGHILGLIKLSKARKVPLILVEHLFDDAPAQKIKREVPKVRVESIAAAVGSKKGTENLIALYDQMVSTIAKRTGM